MAVANEKWKFVFLAEPHTASRAVRDALLKLPNSYKAGSHHSQMDALLSHRGVRHKRSYYTTFCVVRNPADIMVTIWLQSWEYRQGVTLTEFLHQFGHDSPSHFFFRHSTWADVILRYEDLEDGLNCFLRSKHAPSVQLEVVGPTMDKEPWFRYYTVEDLEYVASNFPEVTQSGYAEVIKRQISAKIRK